MRLDRLITLGGVHPLRRVVGCIPSGASQQQISNSSSKWAVPILMYHSITNAPEPGVSDYYKVNTSPAVFREHMQFLADQGYRTIRLADFVSSLSTVSPAQHQESLDSPPSAINWNHPSVVLTFDDGLRNFYTEAAPVLRAFGFTATMFLPTAFIGDTPQAFRPAGSLNASNQSLTLDSQPSADITCLSWSEVRELHQVGIDFGSHTVTHPKLVNLGWEHIRTELRDSRRQLEDRLQSAVQLFCYPYAYPSHSSQFTIRLRQTLQETGYTCCTTTRVGRVSPGDDVYRLKRVPANTMDDLPLLNAKLQGSYDWLALPQATFKTLKSRLALITGRH